MDVESQEMLDVNDKPSYKRISDQIRMQQSQRFVSKLYCIVIGIFLAGGLLLVASIFNEDLKKYALAHQMLAIIGSGLYTLILLLLVLCSAHEEIRIMILLLICFSIGSLVSFVGALSLMNLSLSIHEISV